MLRRFTLSAERGDTYSLNIDHDSQSQGGADTIVIGNVAHPQLSRDSSGENPIEDLNNGVQVFTATTDTTGSLWRIVGTDSGFERLTALYYSRLANSFTKIAGAGSARRLVSTQGL